METSLLKKKNCLLRIIFALFLALCTFIMSVQSVANVAFAASGAKTEYSDVLADLKKDSMFDVKNYPVMATDYSLKIIQLAESTDKELFVYVYQPCGKAEMRASSINISTTSYADITPSNYKLKYINSSGVFFKYVVEGITVSNADVRYYGVTSIYRPFNKTYGDKDAEHGNTVSEVSFSVSKEYRFSTINGNPVTATVDIETIEITDKFVGFVRYDDGYIFHQSACDSHFVAFDTDKPIDRLVEADVAWVQRVQRHQTDGNYWKPWMGEIENKQRTLSEDDDTVHYKGGGIFAATYEWDRIQSITDFIASVDLNKNVYHGAILDVNVVSKITEEGKQALKNKKWVLRFADTSYAEQYHEALINGIKYWGYIEESTLVSDVTILRLKFITDGVTYNLGVIDNKQTGSNKPINDTETNVELNDRGKGLLIALAVILLIVLLCVLSPLLSTILQFVGTVISVPFKAVGKGIRNAKNRKRKKEEKGYEESVW